MRLFHGTDNAEIQRPTVLTLGVFDGLHLGHQLIMRTIVERARAVGAVPTVITFDPHPRAVLHPESAPPLLQTFDQKIEGFSFIGDSLVALRTYETLRVLDVLANWPELSPKDIRFYAHGRMGVHGRLAAALDPRITGCEWQESFRFADFVRNRNYDATDIKSVLLPGALRHFDLDEL